MDSSRTSSCLFFVVLSCLSLLLGRSSIGVDARSELPKFDSIYQLGDSIADTGNMKREKPALLCAVSPYGETFSNKPTGRCSDGLLMIDYFARAFNLPLLNPYLAKDADFTHGVNFAVVGATALDASKFIALAITNSSLSVQLEWFRSHINSIPCSSSSDCKNRFKGSLFMVGEIGGNDYNYPLLVGKPIQDVAKSVPRVVQAILNAVNEVIKVGAKQVIVPGNFPIGCMVIYHNTFATNNVSAYDNLGCLKELNQFADLHNQLLKQGIRKLQVQNPGVAIHYGDYYNGFLWLLNNAASLGFEKTKVFTQCCGTKLCDLGSALCEDPKKRISWDGVHLTQEAYRQLANWLLSDIFLHATPPPSV